MENRELPVGKPLTPSWVGRVPYVKPGVYADGMPVHHVQYLCCKLIHAGLCGFRGRRNDCPVFLFPLLALILRHTSLRRYSHMIWLFAGWHGRKDLARELC